MPTLGELIPKAKLLAWKYEYVSPAFFQRYLKISYRLAAGLIVQLESEGIIGPPEGARPRKVIKKDF